MQGDDGAPENQSDKNKIMAEIDIPLPIHEEDPYEGSFHGRSQTLF